MDNPPTVPPPPAAPPPPLPPGHYAGVVWRSQEQTDREHLRLLMIFHFAMAGMELLGIGVMVIYYFMIDRVFTDPAFVRAQGNAPMPPEFLSFFRWFIVGVAVLIFFKMVLNALSGWCILRRKARTFSLVLAGLNCLSIPLGTILGVFTFLILQRPIVKQIYADAQFNAGPPGPTV